MPRKNEIDMLHGPLLAKIIIFAMPLAASSILQQLFNSVDVAVVGRFDSSYALAAVGSNGPVISLLINLFLGISMGANVVISNHIGQKDNNLTKYAIRTTAATALFSGLALAVIGVLAARPILTIMGTPTEVLDMAVVDNSRRERLEEGAHQCGKKLVFICLHKWCILIFVCCY